MVKNLRCPECGSNAWHIQKEEDGSYVRVCMTTSKCRTKISGEELDELKD